MSRKKLVPLVCLSVLLGCSGGGEGPTDGSGTPTGGGPGSFGSSEDSSTGPTTGGPGEGTNSDTTGETGETGDTGETGTVTGEPTTSGPTTTGTDTGESTDATTGGALSEDEVLMRAAIAGEAEPGEALQTISDRGGLPVITSTGSFLFGCLCGPGTWNLAGMHNGWTDDPMGTTGPLSWAEAEVAAPDGSLYKFHDTAMDQWIADPMGRRYGYDDNGRYTLVRAEAAHLERWFAVEGEGLQPRDLQVWVPDGGAFTHALYVHDGQNLFDPDAFWGGWKLQTSVPPGLLLVGIDNTSARFDEYTHVLDMLNGDEVGGQADAYADLVDQTIRPRMEAAYGAADVVGTMGSSLGGLVAFAIADRHPDRYAMAISLSGTMGWGSIALSNETMMQRYVAAGKRDFALYLDSGGDGTCVDMDGDGIEDDGTANDNYCENLQFFGELQGLGYAEGEDLWYVHDAGGEHNEAYWAARVGVPMTTFAGL
jgi:pimeloyl-ACP methyl ester carboxylesterase